MIILRKTIYILFFLLFIFQLTIGQKRRSGHGQTYYACGAEANIIPYLSGGYSGTLWWGINHIRISGTFAKTNTWNIFVPSGFENNVVQSYALNGEYFFSPAFKNLWAGGGAEYWQGAVDNADDHAHGEYTNYMLTVGAGYVIKIWKGIYVNAAGSVHLVVAGGKVVEVGNATFNANTIVPDVAIKIGYHLPLARVNY
jgi:hypothetical protein